MLESSSFQQYRGVLPIAMQVHGFLMQTCTTVLRFSTANWEHWPFLHCHFFFFNNAHLLKQLLFAVFCVLSIWTSLLFYLSTTSSKTRSQQNRLSFNCLVQCFSLFKVLPVFFKYLRRIQTPSSFEKARLSSKILRSSLKLHWTWSRKSRKPSCSFMKLLPCLPPPPTTWLPSPPSHAPYTWEALLSKWFLYRFLIARVPPKDPRLPSIL